ncbi:MAG: hypothetical protein M1818_004179 [Claussenomyces sp. TS43310]|nr:MAG: hypothetical protein M1818_004179 [Claussenomyces sp. TS43310]
MPAHPVSQVEIPNVDIWEFLFERKHKPFSDDQIIYTCPLNHRRYSYADVRRTAEQFGAGLRSRWAWKKNDVLALVSPNCIDTPAVTLGCHWAGGIVSPANPAYTAEELAVHLEDCDAKLIVTQTSKLEIVTKAARAVGISDDQIILIGEDRDASDRFRHFTSVLNSRDVGPRTPVDPKEDLAYLVYSSGTTGRPKGVMLTHTNQVADMVMLNTVEGRALRSGHDKILSVLPYYHVYGLQCIIHQPLLFGVESVVMPAFDLKLFCSIIQEHKITYSYVAPPIVLHLAKNPIVDDYDLSSLRFLTSGAAPLTKDLILGAHERLGIPVKQAYGLSETSPVSHMMLWDDSWKTAIGSVGPKLPNLTAKFVDPDGNEVAPGTEGELWLKGPTIFKGYHRNPAATAECMHGAYFKTGDVGYEDARGNLHITDRVKELIKYKGSQVAPAELEGLLHAHPYVRDCAVVGFHVAAIASEVPLAFVVPQPGTPRDETAALAIVDWLRARTAQTKRLRGGVAWVDDIPKSASGKILRRILKAKTADPSWSGAMGAAKYTDTPKAKL